MGYREKVVAYAKSQIGVCEPNGDDKYIKEFNRLTGSKLAMNVPWCMTYATCCIRAAGVPEDVWGNFAQCTVAVSRAKTKKIWYSRLTGHKPKPGEWIIFDWDSDGKADHVGIVKSSTTNSVTTIEGNAKGSTSVDGVREKNYSSTSKYIMGYIDIPYPDETESPVKGMSSTQVDKTRVKEIQAELNRTFGAKLSVDGIYGPKTKKYLIQAIQSEMNKTYDATLSVDGIWGPKSKKAFSDVRRGDKGGIVTLVQCCLVLHGADIEIDGDFGKETMAATKRYQSDNGLANDGVVGRNTITSLLK